MKTKVLEENVKAEIVLDVKGMTCEDCAEHVTAALKSVAGVETANVREWKAAQANVVADAGLDANALLAALDAAGYGGTIREHHQRAEASEPKLFLDSGDLSMADSCCAPAARPVVEKNAKTRTAGICPRCGQKGKPVDNLTVKAMLALSLTKVRTVPYFFCRTADCPVVYFAEDGEQRFTTGAVRERVHQKEPDADDVFVCYCFRHTPESIRAEWLNTGRSTVVDAVNAGIQAGQCACDLRNPQGSCCLGNVRAVVKRVTTTQPVLA